MGVTNKSTKTETMTKEKAIEMITKDIKLHGKYLSGQYREALKLAVDVLKESIASDSARHQIKKRELYRFCRWKTSNDRSQYSGDAKCNFKVQGIHAGKEEI